MSKRIAIVGAGLVGRLFAWRLAEQGILIDLYDQYDRHYIGTGLIAAAMIAPFTEAITTGESEIKTLGTQSWHLWQRWLPELTQTTDIAIPFNQQGTLVVAHPNDRVEWQRFQLHAAHILPAERLQSCTTDSIKTLEPELASRFHSAYYFPQEGTLDNAILYQALNQYLSQSPHIHWYENQAIPHVTASSVLPFNPTQVERIIDCRGLGAKADWQGIRGVRGEIIRVYAPEVKLNRSIRLLHPRYPLYIAPRQQYEYVIGATQIESESEAPVTVRSALELLSALHSLHSGFAEATILRMQSGLRPAFSNNLPQVIDEGYLVRINGLYRHGYLLAPALINQFLKTLSFH